MTILDEFAKRGEANTERDGQYGHSEQQLYEGESPVMLFFHFYVLVIGSLALVLGAE
ncbi:hypothetical protein [Marinobacter alkaliphilus]|uniref:Uncharacterized protein n=1 Tax=Marinobacter alkaliphilus TaxID=254719 RepID=A0ABZ3E6G9_9GAMM